MRLAKGNLTRQHELILALVLVAPLLVAVAKSSFFPCSEFLRQTISLADLPVGMHKRLLYILTVPLGAIFVVFCRLTLGIRLLGPFRSILLALSFGITGIWMGMGFMAVVVGTIAGIRPTLKNMKLPYFARLAVILSTVAVVLIATIIIGANLRATDFTHALAKNLLNVAFFPIFVLCLIGDAFSRILAKEGARSAFWRAATTVLVGVALTWIFMIPGLKQLLLHYPELLVTQVGLIVVIAEYLDLRLLEWMNPGVDSDSDDLDDVRRQPKAAKTTEEVTLAA